MFFRRKTKENKENHAKSVQNVRKLLFSLGKTKEKQKKKIHPNLTLSKVFTSLLLLAMIRPSRLIYLIFTSQNFAGG